MSGWNPDPSWEIRRLREAMSDRRERIATAVLAGIVAHHGETKDLVSRATAAVAYADALSAELDKEVKP